ncbi:MAG: hypothetical protein ABI579_02930 [Candidatus Sumerlaeota bacterium]
MGFILCFFCAGIALIVYYLNPDQNLTIGSYSAEYIDRGSNPPPALKKYYPNGMYYDGRLLYWDQSRNTPNFYSARSKNGESSFFFCVLTAKPKIGPGLTVWRNGSYSLYQIVTQGFKLSRSGTPHEKEQIEKFFFDFTRNLQLGERYERIIPVDENNIPLTQDADGLTSHTLNASSPKASLP